MRISDWSSDVCSSDLLVLFDRQLRRHEVNGARFGRLAGLGQRDRQQRGPPHLLDQAVVAAAIELQPHQDRARESLGDRGEQLRSEEHTSELQSLMRISYAVFCLKKKKNNKTTRLKRNCSQ